MTLIIGIIATGFVVGLLVGLTGMGGALLMTPLLIVLYGFSPTMAIGTDLVYACATKAAGSIQHYRQKTVDWEIVKKLAQGSVPGGILGVFLIRLFDLATSFSIEMVLGTVLGYTFILVSLVMVIQLVQHNKERSIRNNMKISLRITGFLGGLLVGLTSVGSGSVFIAILILTTALSAAKLVGTDVVHAFILTLSAGAVHASFGHVDWTFVIWLLIGSIPGILLGGKLTLRIPEFILRLAIVLILFLTGIKLI
ncbi:sulfite exporter TauE/SafE family protein [Hazenella sp. IB182357]|uniref:Probable membrane transporter protein n=1 Tax=Polycladospora coralii TaxID=2771432 RepID=A0A926RYL5_9BACL|nr:sulfite exporter TauE/SafE family protein [Polycladospora coralii]MBD1373621.1 sulfite exporter TauE/SafE family protein [Polycladospora coralii]MBS7529663.1 sulfite exporter TauE/SafE family protein [Polycladospora coralii]